MQASLTQALNGLRVSRETVQKLEHFASLFQKWARSINLVAPSTLEDLWRRHILDSLQLYQLSPGPKTWVDLGSGGGFPGVITAICLSEAEGGWVHLVESNNKKAAFLRVALRETEPGVPFIRFESRQRPPKSRVATRFRRVRSPI